MFVCVYYDSIFAEGMFGLANSVALACEEKSPELFRLLDSSHLHAAIKAAVLHVAVEKVKSAFNVDFTHSESTRILCRPLFDHVFVYIWIETNNAFLWVC